MYLGGEDDDFDAAWLKHLRRNPHHWQYWVRQEGGGEEIMPIPDKYRKEMLADWRGMARTLHPGGNAAAWYRKHGNQLKLHGETRKWLERELKLNGG